LISKQRNIPIIKKLDNKYKLRGLITFNPLLNNSLKGQYYQINIFKQYLSEISSKKEKEGHFLSIEIYLNKLSIFKKVIKYPIYQIFQLIICS